MAVITLPSIPYLPPFHIFLPTDCILKIATTFSSLPLKFKPSMLYKIAFQKECKPQAAQILLNPIVKNEKIIEIKTRFTTPITP